MDFNPLNRSEIYFSGLKCGRLCLLVSAGMRARHLMIDASVSAILLTLTALPVWSAQDDPAEAIADLRQVAKDLTETVRLYQVHLDREIALHDRGYRTEAGRRIPGADADLFSGPSIIAQDAIHKLFAARMIAARKPGYAPAALTDADRLQFLILEARARIERANRVMRQFMMISAGNLNSATEADARVRRLELLKARDAAVDAAKKALVTLPVEMPSADSPEELRETAWDLIGPSAISPDAPASTQPASPQQAPSQAKALENTIALPLAFEQGKKMILLRGPFRRITLTDSGLEDQRGRRLFYQERWEQGMGVTSVNRWAVAVDTATGQHTLLRHYETHQFREELESVYQSQGRDYPFQAKLPGQVKLPEMSISRSLPEVSAATDEAANAREALNDAVASYKKEIREALAQNDASLAAQDQPALDDELPDGVRENLFAIRAHLAGTASILAAENAVRRGVERVTGRLATLDAMVAWVNGNALEQESPGRGDTRALLEALNRSDSELYLTRSLEREALAALPPDGAGPEARFPSLMKDVIVRIRGVRDGSTGPAGTVRCRQEVWRMAGWIKSERQVKRTIVLVDIGKKTASQIPAAREVRYYRAGPEDILEAVYDEYAAQQ